MKTDDPLPPESEVLEYLRGHPPQIIIEGYDRPDDIYITKICGSELCFRFLKEEDAEKARDARAKAAEGVERMQAYISPAGLEEPVVEFHTPRSESGLLEPVLPSFSFDKRVTIKALAELAVKNHIKGFAQYGSVCADFSLDRVRFSRSKTSRVYALFQGQPLVVKRYPVMWAYRCGREERQSSADPLGAVAFEALCQQLEPWTSARVVYHLLEGPPKGMNPQTYANSIVQRAKYDECMIAEGIVKAWLLSIADDTGIDADDIFAWRPRSTDYQDMAKVVKNIHRRGPAETIGLYKAESWSTSMLFDL